ncbi:pilus assembly protein CpaF [[Clostridium] aminophilum]|uniref:Pilus assembly protein CpaF n=2 Tax=[Clostridium] aminophilum TaxID=1526 RepID=A0A1I0HD68_9FIRM|nr:CpaF family protein [[Clostridium] aminophilum]SET81776.1 pilus assembly protein CpaF [[Clostridium] aminophilum]
MKKRKTGETDMRENASDEWEMDNNRTGSLSERIRDDIEIRLHDRMAVSDEELAELIDDRIREHSREGILNLEDRLRLRKELFDSYRKLGVLQDLVDDPNVTEIMVNGYDCIFFEKRGRITLWDRKFRSEEELEDLIQQIVGRVNRTVNLASPIADARLEDGSRVHVVLPPVSIDGASLTIRKFPESFDMKKLIAKASLTEEAAEFLQVLVRSGYNIFISGGTGSGKTTFLNALSGFIPASERVITIEDSAELQIQHVKNLIRLETREATRDGAEAVTMRDLIRASLRMRPDRIIVGEIRGAEALDMLQAMNTGHDGSLSTGHANSAADALIRIETMVLTGEGGLPLAAIRRQIASAIDLIIQIARLRDRSRRVMEITEVTGYENGEITLSPIFRFEEEGWEEAGAGERKNKKRKEPFADGIHVEGTLRKVGELKNRRKLLLSGICTG